MGVLGVGLGLVTALANADASPALYAQMLTLLGAGGAVGLTIASRTGITGLPQLVAAFHSLVGLAAVSCSNPPPLTQISLSLPPCRTRTKVQIPRTRVCACALERGPPTTS
eukprot:184521-Pyramimonas_sp.AAC.1